MCDEIGGVILDYCATCALSCQMCVFRRPLLVFVVHSGVLFDIVGTLLWLATQWFMVVLIGSASGR